MVTTTTTSNGSSSNGAGTKASSTAQDASTAATAAGTTNNNNNSGNNHKKQQQQQQQQAPMYVRYPVNSCWELTLKNSDEKVSGRVYCTDEISETVVLQKALVHTTLASEVRIIHAHSIASAKELRNEENNNSTDGGDGPSSAAFPPLPKVQKKVMEERERRAMSRLADEGFLHINQKATPEGQNIFDRLLKACSQVVWKGESILVLNQIQVDPPYGPENCKIIQRIGTTSAASSSKPGSSGGSTSSSNGALEDGSLERVRKIVAASSTVGSSNNS